MVNKENLSYILEKPEEVVVLEIGLVPTNGI